MTRIVEIMSSFPIFLLNYIPISMKSFISFRSFLKILVAAPPYKIIKLFIKISEKVGNVKEKACV